MKTLYFNWTVFIMIFSAICLLILTGASTLTKKTINKSIETKHPPFTIQLDLQEYSVFAGALISGLEKHRGEVNYNVNMANRNNTVTWQITFQDQAEIKTLAHFLRDYSEDWREAIEGENPDSHYAESLKIIDGLQAKVAHAQASWVNGEQVEDIHLSKKRENTLELFVLSLCPFAQQAENSILQFLTGYQGEDKPQLEVRYIFYLTNALGEPEFTTLHGELETIENLVQMLIRDRYPEYFYDYLWQRIQDNEGAWQVLAAQIAMSEADIQAISRSLVDERTILIEQEYAYVMGVRQVEDGSPTYIWEGERVSDIRSLEAFKDLPEAGLAHASCSF